MTPDALAARASAAYGGLALRVRRGAGERIGDHRVPGRPQASGLEIESYTPYAPGDDLRHLDWSAMARLDVLLTRRFTAEREVPVHLLVDVSASMGVPARDAKLAVACELAMALAWMALATNDPVRVVPLGAPAAASVFRRPSNARRVAVLLSALTAGGALDTGAALAAYAAGHREPGAVFVLSDFMAEPDGIERGVQALRARRHQVVLLHVIGRGELEPTRDVAHGVLADVESGATHPIVLTPAVRRGYDALLAAHLASLDGLAARNGATYARLPTDEPVTDFVTGPLARLGLVRRR
jgi:uncharacterized protein (DUF58 family)